MSLRYWEVENICTYCGAEYGVLGDAKVCRNLCGNKESDLVRTVRDGLGFYICPTCEDVIISDTEYHTHSASTGCSMYGSSLHGLLRLFMMQHDYGWDGVTSPEFPIDADAEFDLFIKQHWHSGFRRKLLPPIVGWIKDKLDDNQSLTTCAQCGKNYAPMSDQLFAIYDCHWHEINCLGREESGAMVEAKTMTEAQISDDGISPIESFVEEALYCEFIKLGNFQWTYQCEMCNELILCSNDLRLKDELIGHYVAKHNANRETAFLTIRFPVNEPRLIAGKINLLYRHKCYFCLDPPCNGETGFGTFDGVIGHLKTVHKIDGKAITSEYAIHVHSDSEKQIQEEYHDWLKKRFDSQIPINQCAYCKIYFTGSKKFEENAQVCHRHEFVCQEKFKK